MSTPQAVEQHYASAGIAERILAALRAEIGTSAPVTPDALAPLDHFHGRGLQATKELAALLAPKPGEQLLDIGSGIGGPARWIAAKFGCHVTGIDLTAEFCAAAEALTVACGMAAQVRIVHGSALTLPFPDASFDRAYSQNVVMNIADKRGFYAQAFRVLRPGGTLALSNLGKGAKGEPIYPVPWASTAATSFLATLEQTQTDLLAAGFEIISFKDTTAEVVRLQAEYNKRLQTEGLPALGVHVIMGERMRTFQMNSARNMQEGRTATLEALVRKPG
jgi:SAM-dependent methyltransferase